MDYLFCRESETHFVFIYNTAPKKKHKGITRDIKRRIETVHNWYGKVASPSTSSNNNSNNNNKIRKKSREVESLINNNGEKMNTSSPPSSSLSIQLAATAAATTTGTPQQQQRKSPRVTTEETKPKFNPLLAPPQSTTTTLSNYNNNDTTTTTTTTSNHNYPNNEHDTILSLYDAKYRNVMFKAFLELNKDDSKKKQMAMDICNTFKVGGKGRFFKVERGGKSYVQVNDKVALQSKFLLCVLCVCDKRRNVCNCPVCVYL